MLAENMEIRSIAIVRALQLSDMLCAIPAWRALRMHFPKAHITLIGLPWAHAFSTRFQCYFDEFMEFPGFPGLPEQHVNPRTFTAFLEQVQARRFDLTLQMQGDGRYANSLVALFGARLTAGFVGPREFSPHPSYYLRYPTGIPEIHRHLRLMEFLGIPIQGEELEFPITKCDFSDWQRLPQADRLTDRPYVCLHPGGPKLSRRWSVQKFAQVADTLMSSSLQVVLTGNADEHALVSAVNGAMRTPALNLAGLTDLGTLGALLKNAALLIASNTAVAHIASALSVPSVIVSPGCDAVRWGPLNRRRHRLQLGSQATVHSVLADADDLLAANQRTGRLVSRTPPRIEQSPPQCFAPRANIYGKTRHRLA
jgi:ADP-heptose:LPS heptosyltransferase